MPTAPKRDSGCLTPRSDRDGAYRTLREATPASAEALRVWGSSRWQRVRRMALARDPVCVECARHGRTTPTHDIDHVVPITAAPDRAYDLTNLQGLCRPCHNRKTRAESRA